MKITFDEISVKATKRWIDANGVRRQQTRKFAQTLNPFNRNPDGSVKTRDQIYEECMSRCKAWMEEPIEV